MNEELRKAAERSRKAFEKIVRPYFEGEDVSFDGVHGEYFDTRLEEPWNVWRDCWSAREVELEALRQALAVTEQSEPVAYMVTYQGRHNRLVNNKPDFNGRDGWDSTPLYTPPPTRKPTR